MEAQLFDAQTIDSLQWPLQPLVKEGIRPFVANIDAELYALRVGNFVFPVVVTQENYGSSLICSPYDYYITAAREALPFIGNRFIEFFLKPAIGALGKILRAGHINSVVYVNHHLFSTDLYPAGFSEKEIAAIVPLLKERFPKHAIAFRSLNSILYAPLMDAFKKEGFKLLATRQVFINKLGKNFTQRHSVVADFKLFKKQPFEILDETQISPEECAQFLKLYNSLYLEQHTYLSPQYTERFIRLLLEKKILQFRVLKKEGVILAVGGYFVRDGVMICPLFGYDKTLPEHMAVYRVLNLSLYQEAQKRGVLFHECSGASYYKQVRGAEGCIDYTALYIKHLPMRQKATWNLLISFINTFAPRLMAKY